MFGCGFTLRFYFEELFHDFVPVAGHVIRIKAMDTTLGEDYAAVERLRSRVCTGVRVLYGGFCNGHQLVGATAQQKQARPRVSPSHVEHDSVEPKGARRFLPSLYLPAPPFIQIS